MVVGHISPRCNLGERIISERDKILIKKCSKKYEFLPRCNLGLPRLHLGRTYPLFLLEKIIKVV
jgi:hypothetical protein